jgi:hypothetical protein
MIINTLPILIPIFEISTLCFTLVTKLKWGSSSELANKIMREPTSYQHSPTPNFATVVNGFHIFVFHCVVFYCSWKLWRGLCKLV